MKLNNLVKNIVLASSIFLSSTGCSQEDVINKKEVPKFRESRLETIVSTKKPRKQEELRYCKGVTYVSWTTGDYPFTSSFKNQQSGDSQGIVKATITNTKPFEGNGSLELDLNIDGESKTHRKGEFFIDLRYPSMYNSVNPINIKKDKYNNLRGVDLSGKEISAKIYCQEGVSKFKSAPNGLQPFAASVKIIDGKEVWGSYYGNWNNIWSNSSDGFADSELGNLWQGKWNTISM